MKKSLDIQVKDTALIDGENNMGAMYRVSENGTHRYKVRIYLDGPGLPFVEQATYHLHHTFGNPVRVIKRTISNQNCKLELFLWGTFQIKVDVLDKRGQIYRIIHDLNFGKELETLSPKLFNQID